MDYRMAPCETCGTMTYFDGAQQIADCLGPTFAMNQRKFRWPYSRYGRLEWAHTSPLTSVRIEVLNMNPDPADRSPIDVELINGVRSWWAIRRL